MEFKFKNRPRPKENPRPIMLEAVDLRTEPFPKAVRDADGHTVITNLGEDMAPVSVSIEEESSVAQ